MPYNLSVFLLWFDITHNSHIETKQLRRNEMTKFNQVKDWESASVLAANLYGVDGNCEGSPDETFISGWCNCSTMIDEGSLDNNNHSEVLRIIFHDFNNMGYQK